MDLSPRLSLLLEGALTYPITEIVAPAGFGKSTLISMLADRDGFVVARLRNEPDQVLSLLRSLSDAMSRISPEIQDALPSAYANARSSGDIEQLGAWFWNWVKTSAGLRVAIDDVHLLNNNTEAWTLLRQIIASSISSGAKWVLASRHPANLPTVEWIAAGTQSRTINETDLSLTATDVQALSVSLGAALSEAAASDIARVTHGWPLLCAYAVRLLGQGQDLTSVMATIVGRGVEAMSEQLLMHLAEDDKRLLMAVALYDGALPEELEAAGFGSLEKLLKMIAIGVPLVQCNDRRWRLHDLIRDHVIERQSQLRDEQARVLVNHLQTKRARKAALRVAVSSGSSKLIVDVIERDLRYFMTVRDPEILERALELVPTKDTGENDDLALIRGTLAMRRGRQEIAVMFLRKAMALGRNERKAYATARLGQALMNLPGHAIEGIKLLSSLKSDELPDSVEESCEILALSAVAMALSNQHSAARDRIAKAEQLLSLTDDVFVVAHHLLSAAQVSVISDEHEQAQTLVEKAAMLCEKHSILDLLGKVLDLAKQLAAPGRESDAIGYARRAASYAAQTLDPNLQYYNEVSLLGHACRAGKLDEARELRRRLIPVPATHKSRLEATVLIVASELALLEGDTNTAARLLDRIVAFGEEAVNGELISVREIMLQAQRAVIFQLQGRTEEANRFARAALIAARGLRLNGFTYSGIPELEIAKTRCATVLGANLLTSQAEAVLVDMATSAHERYRRDLASWALSAMVDSTAEPSEEARELASGVITIMRRCMQGMDRASLTPAERRVLIGIAGGKSTKEIAHSIQRSTKTVDNHVTSILRKLNAHSRVEAVARARRTGLLDEVERAPIPV